MNDTTVLHDAARHAIGLYQGFQDDHVAATVGYEELRRRFALPLGAAAVDDRRVLEEMLRDVRGGS